MKKALEDDTEIVPEHKSVYKLRVAKEEHTVWVFEDGEEERIPRKYWFDKNSNFHIPPHKENPLSSEQIFNLVQEYPSTLNTYTYMIWHPSLDNQ